MVRASLQQHPHIELVGEAEDGVQAVEQAVKAKPDVVVLDISMPLMNGFQAAREIKKRVPRSAIVILSTHADKHFVEEAKKLGVRSYVAKSKVGERLLKAVQAAIQSEDFVVLD
jgi:DNA-binding NarL/FixJ family response regulator